MEGDRSGERRRQAASRGVAAMSRCKTMRLAARRAVVRRMTHRPTGLSPHIAPWGIMVRHDDATRPGTGGGRRESRDFVTARHGPPWCVTTRLRRTRNDAEYEHKHLRSHGHRPRGRSQSRHGASRSTVVRVTTRPCRRRRSASRRALAAGEDRRHDATLLLTGIGATTRAFR